MSQITVPEDADADGRREPAVLPAFR